MAEERKIKLAMAEAFGCLLIAWIAFLVAMLGFEQITAGQTVLSVSLWVGVGLLIAAFVAFLNDNLLLTMIFGPLGVFFVAFPEFALAGILGQDPLNNGGMAVLFIGVILLLDALVAWMQPVKLLPIFLLVAALLFFFLGLWWSDMGNDTYKSLYAIFALLTSIIGLYMAAAIGMLVLKGKPILPLLIKS